MYLLRVKQLGLSLDELSCLSRSQVYGMMIEQGNDDIEYEYKPTQEDFDQF